MRVLVNAVAVLVVIASCKKTNDAVPDAGSLLKQVAEPSTGIAIPPPVQDPRRTIDPLEGVVLAWNAALDTHDPSALERLYGERVKLYGREMSRADAVASKKKALEKQKDFRQLVTGVRIDRTSPTRPRLDFTKIVTSSGTTKSYAAYLVVTKRTEKLEIVEESDQTTDTNLKASPDERCSWAAASAAMGTDKVGKSLSETITPDEKDAGCTSHGLMPMPLEQGERFVAVRLHTSCEDRYAFRGWVYVSIVDGCVYEDPDMSGDAARYVKLECTKAASEVTATCRPR